MPIDWLQARKAVYQAGLNALLPTVEVKLEESDGLVLAEPLTTLTDLPAFPTSSVDGYAVRAAGPWRVIGRVLAGGEAPSLPGDGTAMEIATGAMVPLGATAIVRTEESTRDGDLVDGQARKVPEWRE